MNVHPKKQRQVGGSPKSGARSKSRIQAENENKIVTAAINHFSRHGYRGTTLDEIAKSAGLSKPNLIYYYKTKEILYAAALDHVLDIWLVPLETLDASSDPEEALGLYIQRKMEMSRDHPEASRMFAMEVLKGASAIKATLDTRLAELSKSKRDILAKWSSEGRVAKLDGVHILFTIWAVTQHYADFEAQIVSQTGKTLRDEAFFIEATEAVKKIIFQGIIRKRESLG